ncbi:MAG: RibD family protein, partial [Candidatus Levybacteria bacterium]|nr:RibD family protein [Candidatus Levybacteria bacterium]
WITNEKARTFAKRLRSQYQAVLVGVNTVIYDNPHLGVRNKAKKDPLRIILDPHLRVPLESQVLRDNNVLLVTTSLASEEKIELLKQKRITVLMLKNKEILLKDLLNYLKEQEIISVLVEGGGKTLGICIDERLFDKVYAFYAPIIIGGKEGVSAIGGSGASYIKDAVHLKNVTLKKFDDNMLIIGYPSMF